MRDIFLLLSIKEELRVNWDYWKPIIILACSFIIFVGLIIGITCCEAAGCFANRCYKCCRKCPKCRECCCPKEKKTPEEVPLIERESGNEQREVTETPAEIR